MYDPDDSTEKISSMNDRKSIPSPSLRYLSNTSRTGTGSTSTFSGSVNMYLFMNPSKSQSRDRSRSIPPKTRSLLSPTSIIPIPSAFACIAA